MSIPVLTAIYPPCIVLVVLSFTRPWWHNSTRIIAPAMFISLIFGILDGIKASAFAEILPARTQRLPLSEQGFGTADAFRCSAGSCDYLGPCGRASGDIQRPLINGNKLFNHGA